MVNAMSQGSPGSRSTSASSKLDPSERQWAAQAVAQRRGRRRPAVVVLRRPRAVGAVEARRALDFVKHTHAVIATTSIIRWRHERRRFNGVEMLRGVGGGRGAGRGDGEGGGRRGGGDDGGDWSPLPAAAAASADALPVDGVDVALLLLLLVEAWGGAVGGVVMVGGEEESA